MARGKMKPGGALPVTEKRSKEYGVRTERKYREARISHVKRKWGGRRWNTQADPVVSGDTILGAGKAAGIYGSRKKKKK